MPYKFGSDLGSINSKMVRDDMVGDSGVDAVGGADRAVVEDFSEGLFVLHGFLQRLKMASFPEIELCLQ